MAAILAGGLGLVIGSFLNVVVFRVPARRSIVAPPSACGDCGAQIRPLDNVPILSWILLRGRCRDCSAKISVRYPLVELGTAVFFAIVALRFGTELFSAAMAVEASIVLVAFLYLAGISIALALIDLDTRTLPNRIVLPTYAVGIVLFGAWTLVTGDVGVLARALLGLGILWAIYLALALVYPGGMGFGDVKLAGVLGLFLGFLGWGELAVGAFAAFLLGGLFAIGLLVTRRAHRKSGIPFGPWMLAGAWVGILAGQPLWNAYLALLGVE